MTPDEDAAQTMDVRALVEASPARVWEHDRSGWLALFAADGEVEDPVGSLPVRRAPGRRDGLGPFYDTFIAPNDIRFEVHRDVAAPGLVARDVTIHTTLPNGLALEVPAYIFYEVSPGPVPRIRRLAAYWELLPMIGAVARRGPRGLAAMVALGTRIARRLGWRGVAGYARALALGTGRGAGRRLARSFADAFGRGDAAARALVSWSDDGLAGGQMPTRLEVSRVLCAGRAVVFRARLVCGEAERRGIGLLETRSAYRRAVSGRLLF